MTQYINIHIKFDPDTIEGRDDTNVIYVPRYYNQNCPELSPSSTSQIIYINDVVGRYIYIHIQMLCHHVVRRYIFIHTLRPYSTTRERNHERTKSHFARTSQIVNRSPHRTESHVLFVL